jgi:hypothetical protein
MNRNQVSRNKQSGSALIGLIVSMAVVYFLLLMISMRGWGYIGYGGYNRGPSFWYWGGPNIHHSPSTRDGSLGGPNNRGGGYSGGK